IGPTLFGELIESGDRSNVLVGYLIGAGLMLLAALVQSIWGMAAERKSLEEVARPLSQADSQ
ncbi:MFS transporter, partial [Pseudomonas syringae]|nr:MFS transporter [Pseudomonas syringae]